MKVREQNPNLFSSIASSIKVEQGYEGIVQKLSNSKMFFNRRYLVVKSGIISYFTHPPNEYSNINQNKTSSAAKSKVHAIDCEIRRADPDLSKKKKRPYLFQISF